MVLSPVLAALAAVILVEDGMPVLFRQERAGRDGEPFTIFKFRTMIRDAHAQGDGLAVNEGDERILRCGDFYRRFGLDELPQLWNVLRGEMSLIGPRPTLIEQVERYSPRQRLRLGMRPGVTGWSQIHGRTSIPWSRRIELDVWYVEHWSLRLDARILWRTLRPDDAAGRDVQGHDGRLGPVSKRSVLLTCAGLRVDVVRAFREALDGLGWDGDVVAVDANPLSPALMKADRGVVVPLAIEPRLRAGAGRARLRPRRARGAAAGRPRQRRARRPAASSSSAPARRCSCPTCAVAEAMFDKYRCHEALLAAGLPSPDTWIPEELPPRPPLPLLVKRRWGYASRDIYRCETLGRGALLRRLRRRAGDRAAVLPRRAVLDRRPVRSQGAAVNVIPRTMIESKGGESIKGMTIADPRLIELGRRGRRGPAAGRSGDRSSASTSPRGCR